MKINKRSIYRKRYCTVYYNQTRVKVKVEELNVRG